MKHESKIYTDQKFKNSSLKINQDCYEMDFNFSCPYLKRGAKCAEGKKKLYDQLNDKLINYLSGKHLFCMLFNNLCP